MTETTSPTNLNADLESSVEQTNTTSNSSEINPELTSVAVVTVYGSYTVLRPRYTVYGDIHGIPYPDTDVCRLLAHTYIC